MTNTNGIADIIDAAKALVDVFDILVVIQDVGETGTYLYSLEYEVIDDFMLRHGRCPELIAKRAVEDFIVMLCKTEVAPAIWVSFGEKRKEFIKEFQEVIDL